MGANSMNDIDRYYQAKAWDRELELWEADIRDQERAYSPAVAMTEQVMSAPVDLEPTVAERHREYLEREWDVKCKVCRRKARATQEQLEKNGWTLLTHSERCPAH